MSLTEVDRRLLDRCLAREPGAWKDFVDRFIGLFVHVVGHTAQVRDIPLQHSDVEDICAEIFLTLVAEDFAVLRRFRRKCSLATYLTVIARRIAVRELTRRRMAEAMGHVTAHHPGSGATEPPPVERVANKEEVEHLLNALPPKDADIVRQYHLEGKSYREISSGTGVPINTVGSTLSRAREKLRQREHG